MAKTLCLFFSLWLQAVAVFVFLLREVVLVALGGSGGDLDSRSLGFVALVLLVTMSETLITETYRLQQKGI